MKVIGSILCKVEEKDIIDDKLIVPEGITEIADSAFFKCITLKEITLPKSIKVIYPLVFKYCSSLEKITFASSIFYINSPEGILSFFDLKRLESININGVEFKSTNNLKDDLLNQEKYQGLMKGEIYNKIFAEINKYCTDKETKELESACKLSKSMLNYVDKITNNIINFKEYNYKKNIHTLAIKFLDLYYDSSKSENQLTKIYL